jgi:threonine-phosphate decarboxylase
MDMVNGLKMGVSYCHGGRPAQDFARFDLSDRPVLDFSISLNPLGPPAEIREKWEGFASVIDQYPSIEGDGVSQYYQDKFGIHHRNFLAGNGSTEVIYLAPKVLPFGRVLVVTPSYHDYERASILAGAKVERFALSSEKGFPFPSVNELRDCLKQCDAVWLARPNNPTGALFPKEHVLDIAEKCPNKWFIIDEAFIQFVEQWKEESLLMERLRPNILVIHSLTKFYALAGLRIGGVVGSVDAITRLREAKEPWTVNGVAERVALFLSHDTPYEEETRSLIAAERNRLFRNIKDIPGIVPFPSSANFILCQWRNTGNLDDLMRHLLLNGAYVRDCRNFPGLEENFFRLGLRTPNENNRLLALMSSFPYGRKG